MRLEIEFLSCNLFELVFYNLDVFFHGLVALNERNIQLKTIHVHDSFISLFSEVVVLSPPNILNNSFYFEIGLIHVGSNI